MPPRGVFLVVFDDDDAPVGCGGVRMLAPDRAEIKHLWLRPVDARPGWGRSCWPSSRRAPSASAPASVVLDTNASLEAAQALYRSSGYAEIEPYNDNPNATHWFAKRLFGDDYDPVL